MAAAVKERETPGEEEVKAPSVDQLEKELAPKKSKAETDEIKVPRKPGKLEVGVLSSLFWLALFSALVMMVMFDPTEDKIIRGTALLLINPEEETREEYWMADIHGFQDWERELNEKQIELELLEDELVVREGMLDELESELEYKLMDVDDLLEQLGELGGMGGAGGEGISSDLSMMADTLRRMEPVNAARVLEEMDFEGAVRICSLIVAKRLAPILDVMEPDFRVELVNAMTELPDDDDFYMDFDW
jgi:flagellar motility protein MotE (MotC chaperone)